jgi:hypothetical protein
VAFPLFLNRLEWSELDPDARQLLRFQPNRKPDNATRIRMLYGDYRIHKRLVAIDQLSLNSIPTKLPWRDDQQCSPAIGLQDYLTVLAEEFEVCRVAHLSTQYAPIANETSHDDCRGWV